MRFHVFVILCLVMVGLNAAETASEATKPKILQPSPDGSILLHSRDVTVHGTTVRYEPQTNKNTIGYWTRLEDWVSWEFNVTKPGSYKLKVLQGCGPNSGGAEVNFISAGQTNSMTVQATKHFQDFIEREVGEFAFPRPAVYTLEVRPKTKPGVAVMDLRQAVLVPK
jgi:arylsulfatase A